MKMTKSIGGIEWTASVAGRTEIVEATMTEMQRTERAHVIDAAKSAGWDVTEVRGVDDPEIADPGDVWVCMQRSGPARDRQGTCEPWAI